MIAAKNIFRIHIKPMGGKGDSEFSFKYCLKNELLGVGWGIDACQNEMIDWESYVKKAQNKIDSDNFRNINQVRYIKQYILKDELVWTRDRSGQYYLAKVIDGWEYLENQEAKDADILNIFRVKMIKISGKEDLPGKLLLALEHGCQYKEFIRKI